MTKEKNRFEYFQIYGTLKGLPCGHVHKENLKEGETPESIAKDVLSKQGFSDFTSVLKSEPDYKFKLGGSDVHFFYNDRSYIQLNWMSETKPIMILYPDASGPRGKKGFGITFNDRESLDLFVYKVLQLYNAQKDLF
jgi:hypothetical protein